MEKKELWKYATFLGIFIIFVVSIKSTFLIIEARELSCPVNYKPYHQDGVRFEELLQYRATSFKYITINHSEYLVEWRNYNRSDEGVKLDCSIDLNKCLLSVINLTCVDEWDYGEDYDCVKEHWFYTRGE